MDKLDMKSMDITVNNVKKIRQVFPDCAKKLFNKMSSSKVRYENVTSYQDLLNKMNCLN